MTIMFIVVLGLFLTFAAFALDLGNMYLWRLRIDKAARAGALAGLGYRGLQGWTNVQAGQGRTALETTTKQAVQDNLSAYGLTLDPLNDITVTYDNANDTISVEVQHSPSTLLVGKLNRIFGWGFNSAAPVDTFLVSREHRATLNRANVVLMIDVSGSMLCPESGDCACRTTNTCAGSTKLDRLIDGVQRFAQQFNPSRDRIAVIPFNLAAQRLYSLTDTNGDGQTFGDADNSTGNSDLTGKKASEFLTDKALLTTVLTKLAGSNTNHCDALAEGILELENLSTALFGADTGAAAEDRRQLQPFVVFFTDGAPNAMRGIFSGSDINLTSGCDTYNAGVRTPGQDCGSNDFYHYALEWVTTEGTTTFQYRGPGPFVAREVDGNGVPRLFSFPIASASVAPSNSKTCGREISDPLTFEQTITQNTSTGPGGRGGATGCLSAGTSSFSFSIPYTNLNASGTYGATVTGVPISTATTTWRDPNWPSSFFSASPVPDYGLQKYDELPYYCAIEAADYIRTRYGGTIFTVGLGNPSTHFSGDAGGQDPTCNDPLQDADDHTSRKDFFLARLAFARSIFTDQLNPTTVGSHYQIAGTPQNKDVTRCSDHRLKEPDAYSVAAPTPRVGYTSADTLSDGNTTYQHLRPLRPIVMDGLTTTPTSGARRIDTQGEYFPTNDPAEIPRIFDLIAKTILLRSSS
jgi:hypothetical protein